ncbi:hypothetical protein VCRA2113O118_70057 [Vibrio crassostreae]|nr:hypothetical protein VCRA2113O119_50166 [Vibrio crassostreae]CAK2175085.1 hypothetical protein VCRA2113O120_70057 [Vibrio crassostreae]CAK2192477.1 hypothetical protein VCRA2110O113_80059 [Vibrio crassostreae]CAK2200115.1 hypothetical protein VCRA2114E122_80166 [Vibrio crassostreae]CAK2208350.1 hypothetical protein VCRA2114E123_80166 [Vibrio crassostreae]
MSLSGLRCPVHTRSSLFSLADCCKLKAKLAELKDMITAATTGVSFTDISLFGFVLELHTLALKNFRIVSAMFQIYFNQ